MSNPVTCVCRFMSVGSAAGVAAAQVVSGAAATVQDVNVTAVQDVLLNKFHQRIHGPPGGPPPGPPGPAYYNVSGAGSANFDGHYSASGTYDGRTQYCSTPPACLYSEGGVWRIAIQGRELFYVADGASEEPPLSGWVCANGSAPAPTLVAGPSPLAEGLF